MKLEKILDNLNSFEKNSFLKIIDSLISNKSVNNSEIDKILYQNNKDLKNIDNINISKVFNLILQDYQTFIKSELFNANSQLDILIDILSREGNGIMKQDWFARLYEIELKNLEANLKIFKENLESEKSEIDFARLRDYKIYKNCLTTAYHNDELNNQEKKVTPDEQSILLTLSNQLQLSQEEIKMINYLILPVKKFDIDTVINELKSNGIIFYSKKNNIIYVADEVVNVLRKIRGKEVSDKYFRRVLKLLKEPQINLISRKHGISLKNSLEEKIKLIIDNGISFSGVLTEDIFKDNVNLTEKKKFLNDFFDNQLKISPSIKGITIDDKIANLIQYFENLDKDEKVGISIDGYEKLLRDLNEINPEINEVLKKAYQFQEDFVMKSSFLLDYNIKPRDILEQIKLEHISFFCEAQNIKQRGDTIFNILENYKDTENLFLENYELIAKRDFNGLKSNGINIKESELGLKFEDLTKSIFSNLGLNVENQLLKKINTNKDKIDILVDVGNFELILIECKTNKDSGFNKFSSVSRQLKSYTKLIGQSEYKVIKSLLIAPDFSDDFIKECGLEYELNLSLIRASTLIKILNGFKESKLKVFPYNLLMRDVLIEEERVLKAILK